MPFHNNWVVLDALQYIKDHVDGEAKGSDPDGEAAIHQQTPDQWAHRFWHLLADLGLKRLEGALAIACYSLAVLATVAAAMILAWR